jgi:hypothetical protein
MPRYFFHVMDGVETIDTEGTELAGFDEARVEAIVVSGEMLKDHGRKVLEQRRMATTRHG